MQGCRVLVVESGEDSAACLTAMLRLNGFDYLQLRQIQEALDRLALGEFGICLACEQPIAPKRLQALPWAKYCVKCQEGVADHPVGDDDRLSD